MDLLMVVLVVAGLAWAHKKLAPPATIDRRIFVGSMIELWKRNYPGYDDNVNALPPDMRAEHYMRCELAFGDLVESVAIAGQSKKIWPFRFKEWTSYILGTGMPVQAIAEQCRAPIFAVRAFIVYNNLIQFQKRNEAARWILKGEVPDHMLPPEHDMPNIVSQIGFEDWIFLEREDGIYIPADDIITGG